MAELNFRQKFIKTLYTLGIKHFGVELLDDLPVDTPEWIEFATALHKTNDLPSRREVIRQIAGKGVLERAKHRERDG